MIKSDCEKECLHVSENWSSGNPENLEWNKYTSELTKRFLKKNMQLEHVHYIFLVMEYYRLRSISNQEKPSQEN